MPSEPLAASSGPDKITSHVEASDDGTQIRLIFTAPATDAGRDVLRQIEGLVRSAKKDAG